MLKHHYRRFMEADLRNKLLALLVLFVLAALGVYLFANLHDFN